MKNTPGIFQSVAVRSSFFAILVIVGALTVLNAQSAGSRGGVNSQYAQHGSHSTVDLTETRVTEYVTVDSRVELRVVSDQIRIVLAIGESAETSSECESRVFQKIDQLKAAFAELGIEDKDVVDDFIAILPAYKYEVEEIGGEKFAVEKQANFTMQSNLHIKVADDAQAFLVIRAAFKLGVTNIIAFDYWSKELNAKKEEALKLAIEKIKAKSTLLLGETFDKPLEPVNVRSSTKVIMPDKLYESFQNSFDQAINQHHNRNRKNLPVITAFRPKNTYYRGYFDELGDHHPADVPMRSEISVVSEVTMYYASPVAREYRSIKAKEKQVN